MINRRNILTSLAAIALAPTTFAKESKQMQEGEESKMIAAFNRIKNTPQGREAILAGNSDAVINLIQSAAHTNYSCDVTFKGNGTKNFSISIRCHANANKSWQFSMTITRS